MNKSQEILSNITIFQKYAKYIPEIQRRETWEDICDRNMVMHMRKYPSIKNEIKEVYRNFVYPKKVLPSMRSMQFGGLPIEVSNSRIFNCAFTTTDSYHVFPETMFNLLMGSGVGYSVQERHIKKLPIVQGPSNKTRRFLVSDNIEGWADAVKQLVKAYFFNKSDPVFDFRDIRPKGARLVTSGGKAPGPDPLRICLDKIRSVMNSAVGDRMTSLQVHDVMCHIADAVLAGGIRRAAMISLFDHDDMDMLYCKSGTWWELNPQRGRANNSVILKRGEITKDRWDEIWNIVKNSGSGEPGFVWVDDLDTGTNPCAEVGLHPQQFCNLTEINMATVVDQEDYNARARAGAFIGTLQAGYTDFHYLRSEWKEQTEKEALLGVSMTGIASKHVLALNATEAAQAAVAENARVAAAIGISPAARVTCAKPAGTTSLVVGSSSGIHAWHDRYYIRRVRVGKNEALYGYLKEKMPDLVEDCVSKPHLEAVLSVPQAAPQDAILNSSETAMTLLDRVSKINAEWVSAGHNSGVPRHSVSCTVSLRKDDWEAVGEWMWENRDNYNGISVFPLDDHTYQQTPFESCDEMTYNRMNKLLSFVDLTDVKETDDITNHSLEAACAGGACIV